GICRSATDNTYEYASGLTREGLLATMSPDRLTDLNRAAAEAKSHGAERRPGAYVAIANHLPAGRAFDRACAAFVSAARASLAQGRFDETQQHLESAQSAIAAQEGVSGPWDARVATVWELEMDAAFAQDKLDDARDRVGWIEHTAKRLQSDLWAA